MNLRFFVNQCNFFLFTYNYVYKKIHTELIHTELMYASKGTRYTHETDFHTYFDRNTLCC